MAWVGVRSGIVQCGPVRCVVLVVRCETDTWHPFACSSSESRECRSSPSAAIPTAQHSIASTATQQTAHSRGTTNTFDQSVNQSVALGVTLLEGASRTWQQGVDGREGMDELPLSSRSKSGMRRRQDKLGWAEEALRLSLDSTTAANVRRDDSDSTKRRREQR